MVASTALVPLKRTSPHADSLYIVKKSPASIVCYMTVVPAAPASPNWKRPRKVSTKKPP